MKYLKHPFFVVLKNNLLRIKSNILPIIRWSLVAFLSLILVLDMLFPPPVPSKKETSTLVVAADGKPLRAFADKNGIWRYPATVENVSPLYLQALLEYEDRWFWYHPGVNPIALVRASWQWGRYGRIISGGSTLSMQVARILDPHSRSILGKIKQIARAVQLEMHFSKQQILILYLERAPYGGTIEGVHAASWAYLGKSASELSHAEAALLAVLPQSPSRLRPDRHPQRAQTARDKVLKRMQQQKIWSDEQVDDAFMEPVIARALKTPLQAALFAQRLYQQYPYQTQIQSTLDSDLQQNLENRLQRYFSQLPERTSAALLVVDNQTLEARAYIGSLQFADKQRQGHVDMVRAWRSPGSTLKPFLYGMALDDGLIHSASLLVDAPQSIAGYRPSNFDMAFHGPVSVTEALQQSLNIPAVDLLDRVGSARFAGRMENGGVQLRFPANNPPNLALILGGTSTQLEQLVGAYTAFQRGGIAAKVRYTKEQPLVERRLMSEGAAWIVRNMLEDNPRPGYGRAMFNTSSQPKVAWKTGTSYGYRDAWAIGSTTQYTVGVWVGRPDGTPLPGQYGAITALPLMFETIDSLPRSAIGGISKAAPNNVTEAEICWPTGELSTNMPSELCPKRLNAWILDGVIPTTLAERDMSIWQAGRQSFQIDKKTGQRVSAYCEKPHITETKEIARWPVLASPWLPMAWQKQASPPPLSPDCTQDGHDATIKLQIQGITPNSRLKVVPGVNKELRLRIRSLGTQDDVQWLLDGRLIAKTKGSDFFTYNYNQSGIHTLTALSVKGAWGSVFFEVLPSE